MIKPYDCARVNYYGTISSGGDGGRRTVLAYRRGKMALAAKLKALRVRKNKSLQDVATEVGASKAHIWDLETGRAANPTIELLTKISRCFDVSVAELIGETVSEGEEESGLIAMYRDLKKLTDADRQAIQGMMDHFRKRKEE